jgi:hypothetical protein
LPDAAKFRMVLVMQNLASVLIRIMSASAVAVMLCGAAPPDMAVQVNDVGPLAQPAPAPAKSLSFQNSMYQAAPVPNPDVDAPPNTSVPEAHLTPRLITPHNLFQGDGFAYASSEQTDARKTPAAGVGLVVPVN